MTLTYGNLYWRKKNKDNIDIVYILIGVISILIFTFFIFQNENLMVKDDWKPWEFNKYCFFKQ